MPQATCNKTQSFLRDIGNNPPKSIPQFQAFNVQKRQTNRDKQKRQTNRDKKGTWQFSVSVRCA
jgi:hypothetical protein